MENAAPSGACPQRVLSGACPQEFYLLGTNWIVLDMITTVNGVLTFTDTNAVTIPTRFYRLSEEM